MQPIFLPIAVFEAVYLTFFCRFSNLSGFVHAGFMLLAFFLFLALFRPNAVIAEVKKLIIAEEFPEVVMFADIFFRTRLALSPVCSLPFRCVVVLSLRIRVFHSDFAFVHRQSSESLYHLVGIFFRHFKEREILHYVDAPDVDAPVQVVVEHVHHSRRCHAVCPSHVEEQTCETYRCWREAGAARYLLRIEASDPELYRKLHPADHSYEARTACLRMLRELDYQVGSGVMIGLPGQTIRHLVKDLRFFQEYDIDMIGMGPYIPHEDTPLGAGLRLTEDYRKHQLELGLKMIACARLLLRDVNIASTTALQALDPRGRELGLLAGANVIMPNLTDTAYRSGYRLYAGKPGLDESSESSLEALTKSVEAVGETILWDAPGDSLHYFRRH